MIKKSFLCDNRRIVTLITVVVMLLPFLSTTLSAQAERHFTWLAYDTEIRIHADGTFHVVETQIVSFTGSFSNGTRTIPLDSVEGITNVQVAVANSQSEVASPFTRTDANTEKVGTYSLRQSSTEQEIVYHFDATSGVEDRVITIEYDVIGGLRVYSKERGTTQQLWWNAVSANVTSNADVQTSTVIVHLPERVGTDETVWHPKNGTTNGRTWVWQWSDLRTGANYDIRLQFPAITDAGIPTWQEDDVATPAPVGN